MAKSNLKQTPVSGSRQSAKTVELDLSVVGLGFRMKRDARRALGDTIERAKAGRFKGVNIKLQREQENEYDINAIRVIHDGGGVLRGKHLGYLSAAVAAQIAPLMDDGLLLFKSGVLTSLDAKDDYKTGQASVLFRDKRLQH